VPSAMAGEAGTAFPARREGGAVTETVLVTGASAGFGAAIARAFQRNGDRVILMARRRDRLEKIAAEAPDSYHVLPCDIIDEAALDAALASLPAPFSQISVLVNNAGMGKGYDPAQTAPLADRHADPRYRDRACAVGRNRVHENPRRRPATAFDRLRGDPGADSRGYRGSGVVGRNTSRPCQCQRIAGHGDQAGLRRVPVRRPGCRKQQALMPRSR
jgi:hypothetical protein